MMRKRRIFIRTLHLSLNCHRMAENCPPLILCVGLSVPLSRISRPTTPFSDKVFVHRAMNVLYLVVNVVYGVYDDSKYVYVRLQVSVGN
jgi:hypothetical protein